MSEEKLLTVREVAAVLNISEKDVLDLAEKSQIPAYKVGGVYLRFKKEQVDEYKLTLVNQPNIVPDAKITWQEKLGNFFYFNDFYILAGLFIILLLVIVYRGL
jgi:excisionase family DNA binding protein